MKKFSDWLKTRETTTSEAMTSTADIANNKKPIGGDKKGKGDKTSPDVLEDGKKRPFPGFKKVDKDSKDPKCKM